MCKLVSLARLAGRRAYMRGRSEDLTDSFLLTLLAGLNLGDVDSFPVIDVTIDGADE